MFLHHMKYNKKENFKDNFELTHQISSNSIQMNFDIDLAKGNNFRAKLLKTSQQFNLTCFNCNVAVELYKLK
jgi:hypothetical protein